MPVVDRLRLDSTKCTTQSIDTNRQTKCEINCFVKSRSLPVEKQILYTTTTPISCLNNLATPREKTSPLKVLTLTTRAFNPSRQPTSTMPARSDCQIQITLHLANQNRVMASIMRGPEFASRNFRRQTGTCISAFVKH